MMSTGTPISVLQMTAHKAPMNVLSVPTVTVPVKGPVTGPMTSAMSMTADSTGDDSKRDGSANGESQGTSMTNNDGSKVSGLKGDESVKGSSKDDSSKISLEESKED